MATTCVLQTEHTADATSLTHGTYHHGTHTLRHTHITNVPQAPTDLQFDWPECKWRRTSAIEQVHRESVRLAHLGQARRCHTVTALGTHL